MSRPDPVLGRLRQANPQAYAIKRLRQRHYMSLESCAAALGIGVGWLVLIERGSRPVPPWLADRVRRLALRLAPRQNPSAAAR